MSMTPRITNVATGITRELIAEQTHAFYDPATGSVSLSFQHRPNLYIAGAHAGPAGDWSVLQLDLAAVASRCFSTAKDPVTGADLSRVSAAGVLQILKDTFPVAYDEAVAAEAAAASGGA